MGDTPGIVKRPFRKAQNAHDDRELPAMSHAYPNQEAIASAWDAAPRIPVLITSAVPDKIKRKEIDALHTITVTVGYSRIRSMLLGRNILGYDRDGNPSCINMWANLSKDAQRLAKKFEREMTQSQAETFSQYFAKLYRGFGLVNGPPGTGKTQLLISTVMVLVADNYEKPTDQKPNRIIVAGPANEQVDRLYNLMAKAAKEDHTTHNAMIVRFHARTTKTDYIVTKARKGDAEEEVNRDYTILDDPEEEEKLRSMVTSMILYVRYNDATEQKYGIGDKRYHPDGSLADWIFKMIAYDPSFGEDPDFVPHPRADPDQNKYASFRRNFQGFYEGELMDKDDVKNLKEDIRRATIDVIKNSDVILLTPFQATDNEIRQHHRTTHCFPDEAAQMGEHDMWLLMANRPTAIYTLFGDENQNKAIVHSKGNFSS